MSSLGQARWVLVVLGVLAVACTPEEPARGRVVAVLPTSGNPYWQTMQMAIEAEGRQHSDSLEVSVETGDEDDGAERQVEILSGLRALDRLDVIILGPASSEAVVPALAPLVQRGAQIVVVDSKLDSLALAREDVRVSVFIGSENVVGGRMAAETIERQLGRDSIHVLLLEGNPVHQSALDRSLGFRDASPERWWVDRQRADWSRERAISVTDGVLASGVPDAIFAASDEMAMGAIQALKARGVSQAEWPVVVGFDATEEGMLAIQAREMCASIRQQPEEMGAIAVTAAVRLARGDTVGMQRTFPIPTAVFPSATVNCR